MRRNSNENPARTELLKSARARLPLGVATICAMAVSAAAATGHPWLLGPLLRSSEGNLQPGTALEAVSIPSPSVTQIVSLLVALGGLRALSETLRTNLAARFQLGVVSEFRCKLQGHVPAVEPSKPLAWPGGELASRIQVEVHGVRTLPHRGVG